MKKILRSLHFFVLIALLSVLIAPSLIVSAESGSIGGKPANPDPSNPRTNTIFIKKIEPGTSVQDAVEVINNADTAKTVQIYAVDSVLSSGGAFACAQAVETPKEAGAWVTFEQQNVTLEAGQKAKVPFKIALPANASPGENNGCIVLQEVKSDEFRGGIGLNFRTAIRLVVMAPGDVVKDIRPLSINTNLLKESVTVSPKVVSKSNVSVDTEVSVNFSKLLLGQNQSQKSVFPVLRDQETEWNFEFKRPFWGGFYRASYSISYDPGETILGQDSGQERKVVDGPSKIVFVTPSPVALLIELLVLLLLISLIFLLLRKLIRGHRVKKSWVNYTVKDGETLQSISEQRDVSWKRLAKTNKIKAPYILETGAIIRVPQSKGNGLETQPVRATEDEVEPEEVKEEAEVKLVKPESKEPNFMTSEDDDGPTLITQILEEDEDEQEIEEIGKELAKANSPKKTPKAKKPAKKAPSKPKSQKKK